MDKQLKIKEWFFGDTNIQAARKTAKELQRNANVPARARRLREAQKLVRPYQIRQRVALAVFLAVAGITAAIAGKSSATDDSSGLKPEPVVLGEKEHEYKKFIGTAEKYMEQNPQELPEISDTEEVVDLSKVSEIFPDAFSPLERLFNDQLMKKPGLKTEIMKHFPINENITGMVFDLNPIYGQVITLINESIGAEVYSHFPDRMESRLDHQTLQEYILRFINRNLIPLGYCITQYKGDAHNFIVRRIQNIQVRRVHFRGKSYRFPLFRPQNTVDLEEMGIVGFFSSGLGSIIITSFCTDEYVLGILRKEAKRLPRFEQLANDLQREKNHTHKDEMCESAISHELIHAVIEATWSRILWGKEAGERLDFHRVFDETERSVFYLLEFTNRPNEFQIDAQQLSELAGIGKDIAQSARTGKAHALRTIATLISHFNEENGYKLAYMMIAKFLGIDESGMLPADTLMTASDQITAEELETLGRLMMILAFNGLERIELSL